MRTFGSAALVILISTTPSQQRGSRGPALDDPGRRSAILTVEDTRDPGPAELKLLTDTARREQGAREAPDTPDAQMLAIRTLGRLERRDAIPPLLELVGEEKTRAPGGSHRRGTIGISTRGRHTGDAQIFVNLVDNPRLDLEYTVFARVPDEQMSTVDAIQEGTRILRINVVRASR